MQETLSVIKEADDISLITLYYARLGLNLATSTDETISEQLEMFIRWSSDEIAKLCNRVFARETVKETFRDFGNPRSRLFLSHYPVVEITGVTEDGDELAADVDYEIDLLTGVLVRLGGVWLDPVVVSYTGGYNLPYDAPGALQQATLLMIREAYYATIRGDATIRMVGHKEARVIYFDPNARSASGSGGSGGVSGGSMARRAIDNLLKKYTRFWI
jgi:hypothetical protein